MTARRPRPPVQGPVVTWAPQRRRCPDCSGLVDWRPGRLGRIHVRLHYRADSSEMRMCRTTFHDPQRPLDAFQEHP